MHLQCVLSVTHTHSSGHTVFDFASVVYISVSIHWGKVYHGLWSLFYIIMTKLYTWSLLGYTYTSPGGQASELYCGGQHAVDVQSLFRTASVQLKDCFHICMWHRFVQCAASYTKPSLLYNHKSFVTMYVFCLV